MAHDDERQRLLEQLLAQETDTLQPLGPGRIDTNVPPDYSPPSGPTPQAELRPLTVEGLRVPEGEGAEKRARLDALMQILPLLMGIAPGAAGVTPAARAARLSGEARRPGFSVSGEEAGRLQQLDIEAMMRNRPTIPPGRTPSPVQPAPDPTRAQRPPRRSTLGESPVPRGFDEPY